jgi:hypothetical protein
MQGKWTVCVLGLLVVGLLASTGVAAAVKTYQVTGPVLEVTADKIVVQKGQDKWEIVRDADTKIPADLKVGDKVTIEYRMTATTVTVKAAEAAPDAPKKESKKEGGKGS